MIKDDEVFKITDCYGYNHFFKKSTISGLSIKDKRVINEKFHQSFFTLIVYCCNSSAEIILSDWFGDTKDQFEFNSEWKNSRLKAIEYYEKILNFVFPKTKAISKYE